MIKRNIKIKTCEFHGKNQIYYIIAETDQGNVKMLANAFSLPYEP